MPFATILIALLLLLCPDISRAIELQIEIVGVDKSLHDNIAANLSLQQQKDHPLTDANRISLLHGRAKIEIKNALQPFGYYNPTITTSLQHLDSRWLARYQIDAGPRTIISSVTITISGEAASDSAFISWQKNIPIKQGGYLLHSDYETAKSDLLALAQERGYLQGLLLQNRIAVNRSNNSATITLSYDSGPRYRFGKIRFQQDYFAEDFLRRFISIRAGDPFERGRLLQLRHNFADSEYFANVDIDAIGSSDLLSSNEVPIVISLERNKPSRYKFGLGYGTDTGPRASVGLERRYINKRGHRAGGKLSHSVINSELTLFYQIPLAKPATDNFTISSSYIENRTDTDTFWQRQISISRVNQLRNWQRTLSLTQELEGDNLHGDESLSKLLLPAIAFQRVRSTNRIKTDFGWLFRISVTGAHEDLLSDATFLQLHLQGKIVQRLHHKLRWLGRANAGFTYIDDFSTLPLSHRFFTGGDQTVRGYKYNSLGPKNAKGEVIGGRYLTIVSNELEFALHQKFAVALFADSGSAFNSNSDKHIYSGAGSGFRWHLPIGTLRFDVAWSVSEAPVDWRLHLGIGADL